MATNVKLISATAVSAAIAGGLLVSQLDMGATRPGHTMERAASASYQIPVGNARCTHLDNVRSLLATSLSVSAASIAAIEAFRSPGDVAWCWQVIARLANGTAGGRQVPNGHARCTSIENLAEDAVDRVDPTGTYSSANVQTIHAIPFDGNPTVCWQLEVTGVASGTWVPGSPQ